MKTKKVLVLYLIAFMASGLVILSGCSKAEKPAETEVEKEESEEEGPGESQEVKPEESEEEPEESTEAEEAAGKGSSEENTLPSDFIGEYWFSSGAGGWGTYGYMVLQAPGWMMWMQYQSALL